MSLRAPSGLARKSLGTAALWFFLVGASAPMTVLAGGVVATYASTGVVGVPLSFIVLTVALSLFAIGYVAMSRYVANAGGFYAYLAQGLGKMWGVVGAPVTLVSYNAIQISLYGLFGATVGAVLGGVVDLPWWTWALLAWAVVATLGVLHVAVNARVLAVMLVLEIAVMVLFDVLAFGNPAEGSISFAPMSPENLLVPGIGGVFALGVAAFVGSELAPVYGEEARSQSAVSRATISAILFIGIFYALSAWAVATAYGPSQEGVIAAARETETPIPFSVLDEQAGSLVSGMALILLITSVFAAMLSFHNSVARYVFALSRERVLPSALDRIGTGSRGGAPIGGSVIQSTVALLVILGFALTGGDPVATLFTWLSSLAAIGILLLMIATSLAVIGYFDRLRRQRRTPEGSWQRIVAPALGAIVLLVILITTVTNISSVLGTEPGSAATWVLPGIVVLSVIGGLIWALVLRSSRPDIYQTVGEGQPKPLKELHHGFENLQV